MRNKIISAAVIFVLSAVPFFPAQASSYPYSVGVPCAMERSTVVDELKNPMICTKIGSVKIWRSNSKSAFVLIHAVEGDVYMQSVTAHFKPSSTLKAGTFKYSLDTKKGNLAAGIKVNNAGIISGIPSKVQVAKFTICAQDTRGKKDCRAFSLIVDPATVEGTWEGEFTLNEQTMIDVTNFCGNTHTGKVVLYLRQVGIIVTGELIFRSDGLLSENTFNRSLDCLPGFSDFYPHSISGTVDSDLNIIFADFMQYEPFTVAASSKVIKAEIHGFEEAGTGIIILQTGPNSTEVRQGKISTTSDLKFNLKKVSNWGSMVPQVTQPSSK